MTIHSTMGVTFGQRRRAPSKLVYVVEAIIDDKVKIWFEGTDYREAEWCSLLDVAGDETVQT